MFSYKAFQTANNEGAGQTAQMLSSDLRLQQNLVNVF